MQRYKITQTSQEFLHNELQARFPSISFTSAQVLDPQIRDLLGLELVAPDLAADLASAKARKNNEINEWRAAANQTKFPHAGKEVACDALSRSDIDAVAGSISLSGAFPVGFPGAWKAIDNTYIPLPDVAAFKAMYASMTLQGTINFGRSQDLKAALALAANVEQVNQITW